MTKQNTTVDYVRRRDEAAEILGVSTRTLARMDKEGRGPAKTQLSERVIGYRNSAIKAFLNSKTA